jgi:hypothetical protein
MTDHEQEVLNSFKTDLYRYFDLFKEGIDERFESLEEKLESHIKASSGVDWGRVKKQCAIITAVMTPIVTGVVAYLG